MSANAPSFSRINAAAAESAANAMVYLFGAARANAATAAARAIKVSARSALRAPPMVASALEHDLQLIVCEW